jgi:hypothetical protein
LIKEVDDLPEPLEVQPVCWTHFFV